MKLFKNKKYYLSILIDFSFLAVLYLFLSFIFKKVKNYILNFQEFGFNLEEIENVIEENMSMLDYNILFSNLELMNQIVQKMMILFFIALTGSFILYCLFQGFQRSFILGKKFKKYLLNFSLVSLVSFSLSLLFLYYALLKVKPLVLNLFSGLPVFSLIVKIILLVILILVLWYYTGLVYVFLGKYKLLEALKRSFIFDKNSVFSYLISVFAIFLIVYLFFKFELFGLFYWVIELILILGIVNYYRYSLARTL